MGVKKGVDNFAAVRAASVDANLRLINHFLEKRSRRGAIYPDLKSLVADVSEASSLHRTTLTRKGSKYLKVLLTYLAAQPGASETISDSACSPALLLKKLMDARLEISVLKTRPPSATTPPSPSPISEAHLRMAEPNWYVAFSDAVMVLRDLMERLNEDGEIVRLDVNKTELIDLSAAPSRRTICEGMRLEKICEFVARLDAQIQPASKTQKKIDKLSD